MRIVWMMFFALLSVTGYSQNFTISGQVKDSTSGEDLIGATIYVMELGSGAATNAYGFYSLTLKKGEYNLLVRYVGFRPKKIKVNLTKTIDLDISLAKSSLRKKVVKVTGKSKGQNVKSTEMSIVKLNMATIKKMPALLGEVDVVKSIQLLPGVSTVGEGASGFNVRGGSIDQNLILLDEAPVFNSSHLFGFFSIFNPDAVKNVTLLKGGIPAKYGGRLSSILDVRMKDGNSKKIAGAGGVGLIFSRLMLEGPILKDKMSFIVAGRRSYIDVLAKPFLRDDLKKAKFNFYDLTAKVNYKLNKNNRFYISAYKGRDVFGDPNAFAFDWGNTTTTLRWNHKINSKMFSNLTTYYSNYDYSLGAVAGKSTFDWISSIKSYSLKEDFSYYIDPDYKIAIGGQSTLYRFVPGSIEVNNEGVTIERALPDKLSLENAAYISNKWVISHAFSTEFGLRFSNFTFYGKDSVNYYGDPVRLGKDPKPLARKEYLDEWTNLKTYNNFEPRFNLKYSINEMSSLKLGYNRMAQYLQLVSNTTASVPLDVWTPASQNVKPNRADQIAIGYFRNYGKNDDYELSVETYYKWMYDLVDYRDGANLLLNEFLEGELIDAEGRAYGLEFLLKKNTGKLTGWLSYTLARTERKVAVVNDGDYYPNRFDQLHSLKIVGIYELNKKWSFSSNFVVNSGTPATFPTDQFNFYGYNPPHNAYNDRNNYRIPAYHRLDVAATYDRKENSQWVFSIYNVYARKNPFSIYFQRSEKNSDLNEAIQYSVLGTIVPSVSYNFKF